MITIALSPQQHAEQHWEIRCSSLSPRPIVVPPPSPSSSSVTTLDEASPIFNPDSTPANSTLTTPTRAPIAANADTSCDEFSTTTRSDVGRDEFLSTSIDANFAGIFPLPSHSPIHFTPVPYVQRGFGYRDSRARGRGNRHRRTKVKM